MKDAILGGVIVALTMIASLVLAGSFQLNLNPLINELNAGEK